MRRRPMPFLVGASVMYIFLPFRAILWERGDSNPRLMRSEWWGVVQGQIQFQCNALPEMIVMEKWTFHFRGSGNAKWGSVDSGGGGIAFGTSSQTGHCWATHVDTDPIHYNISFGDALLYISSVKRACSLKSFRPGSFVMHSDITHTERERERNKRKLMKLKMNFGFVLFSWNICKAYTEIFSCICHASWNIMGHKSHGKLQKGSMCVV